MKKLLCVLLTLSLICCAAALAEGTYDQDDTSATTTLTTTIAGPDAPTFTVVIPPTLAIEPNATSTALTIKLMDMENASAVKVTTVQSGSMTNGSGGTINYTIAPNVLSFSAVADKFMNINITSDEWQQAPAGYYTGTLSFTISAE